MPSRTSSNEPAPARTLIFVIRSDPRTSARPAEAIRIAAGIGALKKVQIILYLAGPAVLILGEDADELRDEESYRLYLPILLDLRSPVYVERGAPELAGLKETSLPVEQIGPAELAVVAARCHALACF